MPAYKDNKTGRSYSFDRIITKLLRGVSHIAGAFLFHLVMVQCRHRNERGNNMDKWEREKQILGIVNFVVIVISLLLCYFNIKF